MAKGSVFGVARSHDVPLLISAKPFLGGTLRQLQIRFKGRLKRPGGDVDVVELAGPVLPCQMRRLTQAAAKICLENRSGSLGAANQPLFRLTARIDQDTMYLNQVLQGSSDTPGGFLAEVTPCEDECGNIVYDYAIRDYTML